MKENPPLNELDWKDPTVLPPGTRLELITKQFQDNWPQGTLATFTHPNGNYVMARFDLAPMPLA